MESGHTGVFFRRQSGYLGGKSVKHGRHKPNSRRWRWPGSLPIVEQFGVSVPQVFEDTADLTGEKLAGELYDVMYAEMERYAYVLQKQIDERMH